MAVFMGVHGSVCMGVLVRVPVLVIVGVRVIMRMVVGVGVLVLMILDRVIVFVLVSFVSDDVDLGPAEPSAHHFAALETGTDVQGRCGVLQDREGDARIDQGTKKHVAGNAGEAFEIRNSHQ
jgi:hypothetical protein